MLENVQKAVNDGVPLPINVLEAENPLITVIGLPYNLSHLKHAEFDPVTGELTGVTEDEYRLLYPSEP